MLITELHAEDFNYTNANGTITLTGYAGPGGNVTIPSTIAGLPVTGIADNAFAGVTVLTGVTIPDSVTNLGRQAFFGCTSLASLSIGNGITIIPGGAYNPAGDSGVGGAFQNCTSLARVTIPDSVTTISDGPGTIGGPVGAFFYCTSLTNVVVGRGLTYLGLGAFSLCTNLAGVYFRGNAPTLGKSPGFGEELFSGAPATAYYLPATAGWGSTFSTIHTALWNPQAQTNDTSFGVRQSRFGFNIAGTPDIPLVIEASTNAAAQLWVVVQSSTLTNGFMYFSDPQWTNYHSRFYRIRSP